MKPHRFFIRIMFPISVLLLLLSCMSVEEEDQLLKEALQPVQERYAPDRRVVVFNITWERSSGDLIVRGDVEHPDARDAAVSAIREASGRDVIDSVVVLPDPRLGSDRFGIVSVSVGNMRSRPGHSAELVTQVLMGMTVKLMKERRGWYYVQSLDRYLGWLEEDAMFITDEAGANEWEQARKIIMTGHFGVVRSKPDARSLPISDGVAGMLLKYQGRSGSWYEVEMPNGTRGYLQRDLGQEYGRWLAARKLTPDNIEAEAETYIGVPYLWGGTSSKGFDCSGFTKTVYRSQGVELNRDANQQALMGDEVPLDDDFASLRKGDLLFFGRKASDTQSERIWHVGIYLSQKEFIHCAGRVRVNSFDPSAANFDEPRLKTLVRARRIIGASQIPEVSN